MPISATEIRSSLQHALKNDILSKRETSRFLKLIDGNGGLSRESASEVVAVLTEALGSDNLDLTTKTRRKNLERLLSTLDRSMPLPLDRSGGESLSFVELLQKTAAGDVPSGDDPDTPLPVGTFGGAKVTITGNGELQLGRDVVELNFAQADNNTVSALWALNRPGQMANVPEAARAALVDNLLAAAKAGIDAPMEKVDEPGKFNRIAAVTAALGVIRHAPESVSEAAVDALLAMYESAPSPLSQELIRKTLSGGATLTDRQQARVDDLSTPEAGSELLVLFNELRKEQGRAEGFPIRGEAAELALNALTFCKKQASWDSVSKGMAAWTKADAGQSGWSTEILGTMRNVLSAYVEHYEQVLYMYGTFENDAPKEVAKISSARAANAVRGELQGDPPSLQNYPLTREQADFVLSVIDGVKDEAAVEQMVKVLDLANSTFEARDPGWGAPSADKPLNNTAFGVFKRAVKSYQERMAGTTHGKLEYSDLLAELKPQVSELRNLVSPRMQLLKAASPTWGGARLDRATADYIIGLMENRLRSGMAVDNINRGIEVIAKHYGGDLTGANGEHLRQIVGEYAGNWPKYSYLDFNKLERIAAFRVRGEEVPLAKIGGEEIPLADFYNEVANRVTDNIDTTTMPYAWMAQRMGFRARQSVELLDIFAEQLARNEGPIAVLRAQFPNARDIQVNVTSAPGAHEEFVFVVTDRNGRKSHFTQGSDGTISPNGNIQPVLFSARYGKRGDLDIQMPTQKVSTEDYPVQTTYAVGDSIDFYHYDSSAEERQDEGKEFATKSKIVEAFITGFTPDGQYTITYKKPGSDPNQPPEPITVPLSKIKDANDPHLFDMNRYKEDFSDVSLDMKTDAILREFMENSQPIIDSILPASAIANMSTRELATAQKKLIKALMKYARDAMKYPRAKDAHPDEDSKAYHDMIDNNYRTPLGKLLEVNKGVCRHQCILEQLLLQRAGIDSRLASGAANTSTNDFRGYHIWCEVHLADGQRFLSDQTWNDPAISLWAGAYNSDRRRTEMYFRTARYNSNIVDT